MNSTSSPPRLRIAYVSDGMADVRMLEILARSHEVTFVYPRRLGERATNFWPPDGGLSVDRVALAGGRLGFVVTLALWLWRHRREVDVAVVIDALTAALGANASRRVGGPPVVLQLGRPTVEYVRCQRGRRSAWTYFPRLVSAKWLTGANERLADGIGAVSDYVAEQARSRNDRVRSIAWYGVDTRAFRARVDRMEARRQIGLPTDVPVVMWRSRLAPEKDLLTFLRAIERLRSQGREICAVSMGGEYEDVAAIATRHGVEIVARAPSHRDEIPLWYVAADVDVQTSFAEGLGISPLEALACGTPVVVTDVGGLPEVVGGGAHGATVPVADAEGVAAAIAGYLDDPERATIDAEAGRRWVETRYEQRVVTRAWSELVTEVAEACGRDPAPVPRLLWVDHQTDLSGGGERDVIDLVRGLAGFPVDVHVAVPGEGPLGDALREHGATVHVVAMDGSLRRVSRWELARRPWTATHHLRSAAATTRRLARLARRLRVDIVHTHTMKSHLLAVPAARWAGAPHVWHVKDILDPGWLRRAFHGLAGLAADRIVCPSRAAASQFDGTRAAAKVEVVHCGMRPPTPTPEDVIAYREKFGAGPDELLVGLVGHTARWKGHDVFVEAASKVAEQRDDVRFGVVASCTFPENEEDFHQRTRARVEELGLGDRLVWLEDVNDPSAAMAAFDLFVHASRRPEPFGRVVAEAMMQGTPVVAGTLGGGPEIVAPGTGRLVDPGDPGRLADVLVELLDDRRALTEMGERARVAAERFDVAVAAERMVDVYRGLRTRRPLGWPV